MTSTQGDLFDMFNNDNVSWLAIERSKSCQMSHLQNWQGSSADFVTCDPLSSSPCHSVGGKMSRRALHCIAILTSALANPESPLERLGESTSKSTDAEATCNLAGDGTCVSSEAKDRAFNMVDNSKGCSDQHHSCPLWAEQGECLENQSFMFENCPFSCKVCLSVTRLYGEKQIVHGSSEVFLAQEMHNYMTDYVRSNSTLAKVEKVVSSRTYVARLRCSRA